MFQLQVHIYTGSLGRTHPQTHTTATSQWQMVSLTMVVGTGCIKGEVPPLPVKIKP